MAPHPGSLVYRLTTTKKFASFGLSDQKLFDLFSCGIQAPANKSLASDSISSQSVERNEPIQCSYLGFDKDSSIFKRLMLELTNMFLFKRQKDRQ